MSNLGDMNDFGHLSLSLVSPTTKPSERDVPMAGLVGIGRPALPFLVPLLADKSRAFFSGSEDASSANIYHYRRCDFACETCSLILGQSYRMQRTLEARDLDNESMKRRVHDALAAPTTRPAQSEPRAK